MGCGLLLGPIVWTVVDSTILLRSVTVVSMLRFVGTLDLGSFDISLLNEVCLKIRAGLMDMLLNLVVASFVM